MKRYIAFLRGINLGKRRLPMTLLKSLFEEIGFAAVETFIASGNVLFSTKQSDSSRIESQIAKHLASKLGYEVDTFVRAAEEVVKVGQLKVFPELVSEGAIIHVGFLQQKLPTDIAKKLESVRTGVDEFRVVGREYFWLCRLSHSSDSKVWTTPEVKALKLPTSTMRNMTSIRKLIAKHLEPGV